MRINYDFGDLEAFVAVMETGSFHQAAERTNLSQPAITRRVRKLEQELGSELFERTTRLVRPTLAGKRLLARAQALLADAEETVMAMRDESLRFSHQRNAVVSVAAVPTVLATLLVPALEQFRAAGNAARVRILDLAANEVAEAVSEGDADFGLCAMPMVAPALSFQTLFDEALEVVLAENDPLGARKSVTWEELAATSLILPAKGTGNRLLIDDALASARVPLTWSYETRRSTTALELARSGLGVAILPRGSLALSVGGGLKGIELTEPRIIRPVGLVTRSTATLSHPAEGLKSTVLSLAAR
ncbi:MAG: LysR family transcriptional regulator [Pseudomonadota bacterium]